LAEVSRSDAEKAARTRVEVGKSARVVSGELEADAGCLIWSFDLEIPGKPGISEVHVDAGDGHVLSVTHETPRQEQTEDNEDLLRPK
jgi:uncharacterized membrane protein YkoI